MLKVAVIGGGISGLTAAWLLRETCDVTLFEAEQRAGGHAYTVGCQVEGVEFQVDMGFIVYNDRTYPNFMRLLDHLGIAGTPTAMSFAVRCDQTGLEYCGSSLNGLFAQRRNLVRPSFLRMVRDILRFNREGTLDATRVSREMTVSEYLSRGRYGNEFARHYLLPMGAAIWSCPMGLFGDFPIHFILEFFLNHGLLSLRNRPQWYTVPGGSRRYVEKLLEPMRERVRSGTAVRSVSRFADHVAVRTDSEAQKFDEVIFACHSDQALSLLTDAASTERDVLSQVRWQVNDVVLHTDVSVLPRRRTAWAAWNYRIPREPQGRPTISYNMNLLQHLNSRRTLIVTLNDTEQIRPADVISRHRWAHPVFSTARSGLHTRHPEFIRRQRTSYCGAWWGSGFHEDGVSSAMAVCRQFGVTGIPDAHRQSTVSAGVIPAGCHSTGSVHA